MKKGESESRAFFPLRAPPSLLTFTGWLLSPCCWSSCFFQEKKSEASENWNPTSFQSLASTYLHEPAKEAEKAALSRHRRRSPLLIDAPVFPSPLPRSDLFRTPSPASPRLASKEQQQRDSRHLV